MINAGRLISIFFSLHAISGMAQIDTIKSKSHNGVEVLEFGPRDDKGEKHGLWTEVEGGTIESTQEFVHGKEIGLYKVYKKGKVSSIYNYDKNENEIWEKVYYDNGTLSDYTEYDEETSIHGVDRSYYKNGQLESEEHYKHGDYHGWQKEYYENGQLKEESRYIDDELEGKSSSYYENGVLKNTYNWKNGDRHGEVLKYNKDGSIREKINYKKGQLDGAFLKVHDSTSQYSGNYTLGIQTGVWKYVVGFDDENYRIEETYNLKGIFHGTSSYFYEDGNELGHMTFENGKLLDQKFYTKKGNPITPDTLFDEHNKILLIKTMLENGNSIGKHEDWDQDYRSEKTLNIFGFRIGIASVYEGTQIIQESNWKYNWEEEIEQKVGISKSFLPSGEIVGIQYFHSPWLYLDYEYPDSAYYWNYAYNEKTESHDPTKFRGFYKQKWHEEFEDLVYDSLKTVYSDETGLISSEVMYKNGGRSGLSKTYDKYGTLVSKINYVFNEEYGESYRSGPYETYHINGELKEKGNYYFSEDAGYSDHVGATEYYDSLGNLAAKKNFKYDENLGDFVKNGPQQEYYPNGKKKLDHTYAYCDYLEEYSLTGDYLEYYLNGTLKEKRTYKCIEDYGVARVGKESKYDLNGNLIVEYDHVYDKENDDWDKRLLSESKFNQTLPEPLFIIKQKKKYGLIETNELKTLIPQEYSKITLKKDGWYKIFEVEQKGKLGYWISKGTRNNPDNFSLLIPPIFRDSLQFHNLCNHQRKTDCNCLVSSENDTVYFDHENIYISKREEQNTLDFFKQINSEKELQEKIDTWARDSKTKERHDKNIASLDRILDKDDRANDPWTNVELTKRNINVIYTEYEKLKTPLDTINALCPDCISIVNAKNTKDSLPYSYRFGRKNNWHVNQELFYSKNGMIVSWPNYQQNIFEVDSLNVINDQFVILYQNHQSLVVNKNGKKIGIVDTNLSGRILWKDHYIFTSLDTTKNVERLTIINSKGKTVKPKNYSKIFDKNLTSLDKDHYIYKDSSLGYFFHKNGRYNQANTSLFHEITPVGDELYEVINYVPRAKLYGLHNGDKWILPVKYENIGFVAPGLLKVDLKNKFGFYDMEGNALSEIMFFDTHQKRYQNATQIDKKTYEIKWFNYYREYYERETLYRGFILNQALEHVKAR